MADDTIHEFRAASRAAEDYLSIEHDHRVGRNAAIISDVATDICESGEMILASLAHAFVMEYYDGGSIDRSPIGCIGRFAELAFGALEGFSGYGISCPAVDSFFEARGEFLEGHDEDQGYDPRSVLRFPDRDSLMDDKAADEDPAGCVEDHLRYVPDCVLLRLLDDVRLINAVHGDDLDDGLPDADSRALVAFFRAVHENDKEISSFAGDDPEFNEYARKKNGNARRDFLEEFRRRYVLRRRPHSIPNRNFLSGASFCSMPRRRPSYQISWRHIKWKAAATRSRCSAR